MFCVGYQIDCGHKPNAANLAYVLRHIASLLDTKPTMEVVDVTYYIGKKFNEEGRHNLWVTVYLDGGVDSSGDELGATGQEEA